MSPRDVLLRVVLVISAAATVATSAPEDFELNAEGALDIDLPATTHLTISADRSAATADEIRLEINFDRPTQAFTVVPDDPSLEVIEATGVANLGQLEVLCVEAAPCEIGFSIDADGDSTQTITAFARFVRYGDPGFFFPDNRDFADDASVEITFDGN